MCGRFAKKRTAKQLAETFAAENAAAETAPHYNISPGQPVAVVRFNKADGKRHLNDLHWGLVPHWSANADAAMKLTNARAETLAEKPSFREAYAKRRCLIPIDAFYEWQRSAKLKQPYAFADSAGEGLALGGVWESWRDPVSGQLLRTFAVVTTSANATMAPIHDRMPVIIDAPDWGRWLGDGTGVDDLLQPYRANGLQCWPVSTRVNNGRENNAELLQPITLPPMGPDLLAG